MRTLLSGPSDFYIAKFVTHLEDNESPEATIRTYRGALRCLDQDLMPRGLIRSNADEIHAAIKTRPAARTRRSYRTAVVAFFARACDQEAEGGPWLDFDPSPWLPTFKVPRSRTRRVPAGDIRQAIVEASEPYRLWFQLGGGQGLRCIEISNLDREHIDAETTWVQGKGSVDRVVPTHPDVWEAVKGMPRGPIARNRRGERATRHQVYGRGNRHLHKVLGYSHISMHDFRRFFANEVHQLADGDLAVSQELLGHASPTTTRVYVDALGTKKVAAVNALRLT